MHVFFFVSFLVHFFKYLSKLTDANQTKQISMPRPLEKNLWKKFPFGGSLWWNGQECCFFQWQGEEKRKGGGGGGVNATRNY